MRKSGSGVRGERGERKENEWGVGGRVRGAGERKRKKSEEYIKAVEEEWGLSVREVEKEWEKCGRDSDGMGKVEGLVGK